MASGSRVKKAPTFPTLRIEKIAPNSERMENTENGIPLHTKKASEIAKRQKNKNPNLFGNSHENGRLLRQIPDDLIYARNPATPEMNEWMRIRGRKPREEWRGDEEKDGQLR